MTPILEARELYKRYGAVPAVRAISFTIRAGEILGVLGPNGAGKSTIVKMVTGLLEPSQGAILFHGERIAGQLGAFKRSLGYVPEQPELYQFLTGWEYLELVATLRGLNRARFREKAAAMLQAFTLYDSRDGHIGSYSKGMRQRSHRFVLAVALGMGWLLAFGAMPDIKAPLMAGYLLTLGLRLAFDVPAGASSGWIFRAVLDPRANETPAVARRIILGFVTPLVILPWLAIACWRLGIGTALVEALFLFAAMICAIELLLRGYRKIPLTCPVPALRENVLMMVLMHLLGFGIFSALGAEIGRWVLASPARLAWIPLLMGGAWLWKRKNLREAREAGEVEEGLTFENVPVRTVERLNLSGG